MIEVVFTDLPESIQLEEGVDTDFASEHLLDQQGFLRIRKTYAREGGGKCDIGLIVDDFDNQAYAQLVLLKETELNKRCAELGIDVKRSGRGITNKSKRGEIREKAREQDIPLTSQALRVTAKSDAWKVINALLPEFHFFESETRLGVADTSFQSLFRPVVARAADDPSVVDVRTEFTGAIRTAIQSEVDAVFELLSEHTDVLTTLTADPTFNWDKAVSVDILGTDQSGIQKPLAHRGAGLRRLLMVATFRYLALRGKSSDKHFVFAVEEPENSLHPKCGLLTS